MERINYSKFSQKKSVKKMFFWQKMQILNEIKLHEN
jgi:hypothetical protein